MKPRRQLALHRLGHTACTPPRPAPRALQSELRGEGLRKIGVHNLSPGMVTTDLLMAGTNTPVAK